MPSQDPFDQVLKARGLEPAIQAANANASAPHLVFSATNGNQREVPCRIQVNFPNESEEKRLEEDTNALREVIEGWITNIIRIIHPTPNSSQKIRPIDLILNSDGTVNAIPSDMLFVGNGTGVYPSRYRIPPCTIQGLPTQERVWRAEKFAMGTIIFELLSVFEGTYFEEKSDDMIQACFRQADFPAVEGSLFQPLIYACWSAEFGQYLTLGKFQKYVQDNPVRFGLEVVGGVVTVAAVIAVPVLGAVGFSAIGPVAGSVAAGWQSSIGAVQAGSLFAFCQSAAMGGAAAASTLAGTSAVGLATALTASGLPSPSSLREVFINRFRRES